MTKPTLADYQRTIPVDPKLLEWTPEQEAQNRKYRDAFLSLLAARDDWYKRLCKEHGVPVQPVRLFVGFGGIGGVARGVTVRLPGAKQREEP